MPLKYDQDPEDKASCLSIGCKNIFVLFISFKKKTRFIQLGFDQSYLFFKRLSAFFLAIYGYSAGTAGWCGINGGISYD